MTRAVSSKEKEDVMTKVMEPIQTDGILVFPDKSLETTLSKTMIPRVKERLAIITPENVREQRNYIENVLDAVETKLYYITENAKVTKLKELRDVALEAFVTSFEVAPAVGSELVKFCREYLPESSEKRPKLKSKALITAIQRLSKAGRDNVEKTIGSISSSAQTDKIAAQRIIKQFPKGTETKSPSAATKGIKIADIASLGTQIDYEALEGQFSQATSNDKNTIILQLAQRLRELNNNSNQSPGEKSSALKTITRLIVQELNAGKATENKIRQLALIIEEASKNPESKSVLNQLKDLNKDSYIGVLTRFKASSAESFTKKQQMLFTEILPRLIPDKFN
jgi:hypothetical protein